MPQPSRAEILVALAGELRRRGPRTVYAVLHVHLPERLHGYRDRRTADRDKASGGR
jgi:hypothetical protein